MTVSAVYRVRQFFNALLARVSPDDLREADAVLPPGAQKLFRTMSVPDQRHSLAVMRTLRRQGRAEPDLVAAALLHDVGKSGAWLTPIHRTVIVLSKHLAPRFLAWLARGEPRLKSWRRPFVVHRQHPGLGAQRAEQAGCSPLTVSLIRRHQDPIGHAPINQEEELLAALQHADAAN